ncbi:hypothetical protein GOP47_0008751 [Adiantum capillus-veneris]|uniref:Uncharacterized protein n=1 Tax=Adiantum capillus-veneris TaxID=13818 RepID=A0A9D4UZG7_ADICA|nr:hypothetical protein GOP47_0008751 [Adiantum capillus-veneris]
MGAIVSSNTFLSSSLIGDEGQYLPWEPSWQPAASTPSVGSARLGRYCLSSSLPFLSLEHFRWSGASMSKM